MIRKKYRTVTNPQNNIELLNLLETRQDINDHRLRTLMDVTGYKKATVCAWFTKQMLPDGTENPAFRAMPNLALRLFKLEIGVTEPSYLKRSAYLRIFLENLKKEKSRNISLAQIRRYS